MKLFKNQFFRQLPSRPGDLRPIPSNPVTLGHRPATPRPDNQRYGRKREGGLEEEDDEEGKKEGHNIKRER